MFFISAGKNLRYQDFIKCRAIGEMHADFVCPEKNKRPRREMLPPR